MRHVVSGLAFVLAASLSACTIGGDTATEASPSPSPSSAAVPVPASPAPQNFANPVVAQAAAPNASSGGLRPVISAEERRRQITSGRQDPFIPVQPRTSDIRVRIPPRPPTRSNGTTPNASPPPIVSLPPSATLPPGSTLPGSNLPALPALPALPSTPPLPAAELASAVEVSGVVQVGHVARAIVKAPNEATSRYVAVGQRLSNGQVLVKRIETGTMDEPLVVLEENGVEVIKRVGEAVPGAETGQTSA